MPKKQDKPKQQLKPPKDKNENCFCKLMEIIRDNWLYKMLKFLFESLIFLLKLPISLLQSLIPLFKSLIKLFKAIFKSLIKLFKAIKSLFKLLIIKFKWLISVFKKYPRGLINFYDEEKIDSKKIEASNIVSEDELDFRKREKMHELLKVLNKVSGETIGISGEQGSGKTTVVKETLLNSFFPKKNFGNSICLVFLYVRLFIVTDLKQ